MRKNIKPAKTPEEVIVSFNMVNSNDLSRSAALQDIFKYLRVFWSMPSVMLEQMVTAQEDMLEDVKKHSVEMSEFLQKMGYPDLNKGKDEILKANVDVINGVKVLLELKPELNRIARKYGFEALD